MKRQDFYYDLPEELIAQDPLKDRSSSRLLVLDKESGAVSPSCISGDYGLSGGGRLSGDQ